MLVSVVICAHRLERADHVVEAVESVLSGTYEPVEIVVVSDGNENLAEELRHRLADREGVEVVLNKANGGLSASRNFGIEASNGKVIAFLDDDAIADEAWLERIVDAYDREEALAVGGRMTAIWIDGKPEFLPAEFYWLIGVTHRGFPTEEGYVRNTFGSNISFRRDVLEELGGFSEKVGLQNDTQIQGDETELAARLRSRYNEGVYYVPDATVGHKIFDYRTDPSWLAERAFWQGYSKRALETLVEHSTADEGEFLRQLLIKFVPGRVVELVRSPSLVRAKQLGMLLLLTGLVGIGYLYGAVTYR